MHWKTIYLTILASAFWFVGRAPELLICRALLIDQHYACVCQVLCICFMQMWVLITTLMYKADICLTL